MKESRQDFFSHSPNLADGGGFLLRVSHVTKPLAGPAAPLLRTAIVPLRSPGRDFKAGLFVPFNIVVPLLSPPHITHK